MPFSSSPFPSSLHGPLRAAAVLLCAFSLAGCSALGGAAGPSPAPAAPSAPQPQPQAAAPQAARSATPLASDTPALASASVPLAADVGPGTLTFSVLDLAVRGKLTQLTLRVLTSGSPDPTLRLNQLLGSKSVARELSPELIDPANLKAYSEADGGIGIVDGIGITLANGTADFTFNYAAPQDPVTALDVAVGSGLPTFRDVPLSR
jgi:hypothetical protein